MGLPRILLSLLWLFADLAFSTSALSDRQKFCQQIADDLALLPPQILEHTQQLQVLHSLLRDGRFSGSNSIVDIVGVPIDLESAVRAAIKEKKAQFQAAAAPIAVDATVCNGGDEWLQKRQAATALHQA